VPSIAAAEQQVNVVEPRLRASSLNPVGTDAPRGSIVRLLVALMAAVLVAAIVASVVGSRGERFQSQALLSIDQPVAIATSATPGVVDKLSKLRGKYVGLIRTNVIAGPVAAELGVPVGRVRGAVSATADPSSLLLVVRAQDGDPAMAHKIAAATAEELRTYVVDEQAKLDIKPEQRFSFELVAPAGGAAKIAPTHSRKLQAGVLGGLLVGGALYLALQVIAVQRKA
jgi:capsular polysaccharide biosynthesis protein